MEDLSELDGMVVGGATVQVDPLHGGRCESCGAWTAIRSRRVDERWRRVLPEILAREAAFLGLEAPCDRVIVCAQSAFDIEGYESFRLQALSYPELALA